jgi:hypothetical protein
MTKCQEGSFKVGINEKGGSKNYINLIQDMYESLRTCVE